VYHNGHTKVTDDYTVIGNTFTAGSVSITVASTIDASITALFNIDVSNELINTGLPVVYIETQNKQPVANKEDYVNGTMVIKQDNVIVHENTMRIRGRGNATWGYPKKPYRIKLDTKTDLLGMGSDKNWVLLANYCDKTLMRTGIGFHLSQLMQFPWTPKAKFVEVVLNGEYIGNYQLVERVEKSNTRINIPNKGYLFEYDTYYHLESKHFVTQNNYGYSFHYPDPEDLTDSQWEYLSSFMNEFENVLYSDDYTDPDTGYYSYIDIDSFVKWFLFQNILANADPNRYLTKNGSGASKIFMGPCVWDFEWSLGIGWYYGERPRPADYLVWTNWY
jgi:spore coat protein CotH